MASGPELATVAIDDENSGLPQDEVEMAVSGINMLLNNGFDEAQALFIKYKDDSPMMNAGYSFVYFMQALISFEEEKLGQALRILQETEKMCETGEGFIRTFKRKFSKKKKYQSGGELSVEDRIQRQTIVADCLLYQAILVFTNQDIASYIKGGWYLRRAWKLYEKLHNEVLRLQEKKTCEKIDQLNINVSNPNSNDSASNRAEKTTDKTAQGDNADTDKDALDRNVQVDKAAQESYNKSSQDGAIDSNDNELTQDVISRLLGSVNFGYGTFQLCMSMVPPKILKLIEFLGFEADRDAGIAALIYCSHSKDMKASLAVLGLLWYHTVLRPFFALDGANRFSVGISDAEDIIQQKEDSFPGSSLFLFFRGRIHRLKKENDASLETYQKALDEAAGQREIELMCLYEIAWCNLLKMKWDTCLDVFTRLNKESRWSKAYYSYLVAVCFGAMGEIGKSHVIMKEVPSLVKRKNNQIEAFVNRRAERFRKACPTQEHSRLLALELLFLWHALPTCTSEELRPMLNVCDMQTDHKLLHLKCLVEGGIFKELGEEEMAINCLKEALARHQGMKDDTHVPAFAMFELASIYMKTPEKAAEAKHLLLDIKENFHDYDFENRLTVRVNNALHHLRRHSKTKVSKQSPNQ